MAEEKVYEVAIVGDGVAGYEAALALKNFKRDFIWLGSGPIGGALSKAERVQNFLSFEGSGKELCALLQRQARERDLKLVPARIDRIYKTGQGYLLTEGEKVFQAKAVIFAPGVSRAGALKGENELLGRGVSYCAVCDGGLYRGKKIFALVKEREYLKEVEYLASFAEKVYCHCLFEALTLSAKNVELIEKRPIEVAGAGRVEKVIFEGGEELGVNGVFILTSAAPPKAIVGGLEMEDGHIRVGRDMSTNLAGFFAAGDVTGRPYQYIKAAGEGLVAAYSVNEYIGKKPSFCRGN